MQKSKSIIKTISKISNKIAVLILIFSILGFEFFIPFQAARAASEKNWDFSSSADYAFDNTKIEFSSGQVQLKATSNWYNSDWSYRKAITIDNTSNSNALTNYQINVVLTSSNFDCSKTLPNGEDIRFTDSDGTTELNSWVENYSTDCSNSNVWVKVPSISALSTKTIYLYYDFNTSPNLKGGVLTDSHGVTDVGTKLGSNAIANITGFVSRMNSTVHPDFTVEMGDKINNSNHDTDITNLQSIKAVYDNLNNSHYYTIGNHDWANITKAEYKTALDIDYTHKSVDVGNYHIIILDAQIDGNQAPGTGHISDEELAWFTTELANTDKKTIIFTHQGLGDQSVTLNPYFASTPTYAKIDNSSNVRSVIENDGDVIAVFQGHTHWDNNTTINNIPYIYVNSLVEDNSNEWAEISIYGNQYLNIVYRQNDATKNFLIWDFVNDKWFNKGSQVFDFFDNFDGDSGLWSELTGASTGTWQIREGGGYLKESGSSGAHKILRSNYPESTNYVVQYKLKALTASFTAGVNTRITDSNNFNALYFNSVAGTDFRFKQMAAGVWSQIIAAGNLTPDTSWHDFKLIKAGNMHTFFYDNTNEFSSADTSLSDAYFGLWNYNAAVEYDNLFIRQYTSTEPSITIGSETTLYPTGNPSIYSSTSQYFTSLSSFVETSTLNGGTIKYQISNDGGTTWYWYNSGWTTTSAEYTEANTASDINSNIATFPVGDGEFLFKAYLHSDGTQQVQLDSLVLSYENDITAPIISITSPETGDTISADDTITFTDTEETDPECSVDNSAWTNCQSNVTSFSDLTNWNDIEESENFTLYMRDTDSSGNTGTASVANLTKADTQAPVRSSGSPSGALSSGTTSTTLSITTSENAACKYSTTSGSAYADMTSSLDTTNGTTHTKSISGLSGGNSYNYYVRCEDASHNTNDTDYLISFSVATPNTDENTDNNTNDEKDLNIHNVKSESTENTITITWKTDHNTKSTIRYGRNENLSEKKKDNDKEKKHKVVLKDLLPYTKYYFRIKATDSDDNEDSSRIHDIMTKPAPALVANSSQNTNTSNNSTENQTALENSNSDTSSTCSYAVQQGDTLWSIAKQVYGDAMQYKKITDLNPELNTDMLKIGQELKLCDNNQTQQSPQNNFDSQNSNQQTQSQPQTETQNQTQPQKSNFVWWKPWTWF